MTNTSIVHHFISEDIIMCLLALIISAEIYFGIKLPALFYYEHMHMHRLCMEMIDFAPLNEKTFGCNILKNIWLYYL